MKKLMTLSSVLALTAGAAMAQDWEISVGVSPGEHAEIMEEVAKVAEPMGLEIDVVECHFHRPVSQKYPLPG